VRVLVLVLLEAALASNLLLVAVLRESRHGEGLLTTDLDEAARGRAYLLLREPCWPVETLRVGIWRPAARLVLGQARSQRLVGSTRSSMPLR